MSRIPLSDEKTYLIFSEEVGSSFGELDGSIQQQILSRLLDILESDASPMQFVREQIGNLDIIAAGDQCRLYTKVVPNIPRGQTEYHVIYVFYIDESHDYQ